jgi:hypothetical protein
MFQTQVGLPSGAPEGTREVDMQIVEILDMLVDRIERLVVENTDLRARLDVAATNSAIWEYHLQEAEREAAEAAGKAREVDDLPF